MQMPPTCPPTERFNHEINLCIVNMDKTKWCVFACVCVCVLARARVCVHVRVVCMCTRTCVCMCV